MRDKAAQYLIIDPITRKEYRYASLPSDQQLAVGPLLDLQTLGKPPELLSGKDFVFKKIIGGSNHPVDARYELNQTYISKEWKQDGVHLQILESELPRKTA